MSERERLDPQPVRSLPITETVGDLDIHRALGWRWRDRYWADGHEPG